jgi:hypothetical protein
MRCGIPELTPPIDVRRRDHINLPSHVLPLRQQWGVWLVAVSFPLVFADAQLAAEWGGAEVFADQFAAPVIQAVLDRCGD